MHTPQTIIFIGPQGSGKGTQVERLLAAGEAVAHPQLLIETGRLFRELSALDTEAAQHIKAALGTGELLPDVVTNTLVVQQVLRQLTADMRLLFDGYPRNQAQAATLLQLLDFFGRTTVDVIHIRLSDVVATQRLLERGRVDDTPAVIETRLATYHAHTEPLLAWYEEQSNVTVHTLDGDTEIDALHEQITAVLGV